MAAILVKRREQGNEIRNCYTSTTPELIECVNEESEKNLGDAPEILNYQDPSILAEVESMDM